MGSVHTERCTHAGEMIGSCLYVIVFGYALWKLLGKMLVKPVWICSLLNKAFIVLTVVTANVGILYLTYLEILIFGYQ